MNNAGLKIELVALDNRQDRSSPTVPLPRPAYNTRSPLMLGRVALCNPADKAPTYSIIPLAASTL